MKPTRLAKNIKNRHKHLNFQVIAGYIDLSAGTVLALRQCKKEEVDSIVLTHKHQIRNGFFSFPVVPAIMGVGVVR